MQAGVDTVEDIEIVGALGLAYQLRCAAAQLALRLGRELALLAPGLADELGDFVPVLLHAVGGMASEPLGQALPSRAGCRIHHPSHVIRRSEAAYTLAIATGEGGLHGVPGQGQDRRSGRWGIAPRCGAGIGRAGDSGIA